MATWHPMDGSPLPVIVRYGYEVLVNTERLNSMFNIGFGDLEWSDMRIGPTPIDSYINVEADTSTVPVSDLERTVLQGYTCPGWVGDDYPTNVQTVEGGKLEQREEIPAEGWVTRQGSDRCYYVQLDLSGRLFAQTNGGIGNRSATFEAQYRQVGAPDWTDFPFSPITITNGITTPVRETYRHHMPTIGRYEVRVRRVTPDETDARNISEFNMHQIKFFLTDDAKYPAQTRIGLMVQATGQLNGRLDRLSLFARAKHWVWNSSQPWEPGVYPGEDARWIWTHTVNPAALFLYYVRGGFLNASATPAYMGGGRGWLDRADPTNGPRLFGAGLTNDRIDYAAIVAWQQMCTLYGLECRMVIEAHRSCAEVLDDIAAAGRASKTWAPGKLSIVWEAPAQPTVAVFGMPNIVANSFQIAYDAEDSVDEFILDFADSANNYQPDTVRAVVPGTTFPTEDKTIKPPFAMPKAQAQQAANLLAASRFYHRRLVQWEAGIEALAVQRGDIVALAHDLTQWASSGRLIKLAVVDGLIAQVWLSCMVESLPGEPDYYIWLRRPDGTFATIQCQRPTKRTSTLKIITEWPAVDAPGALDGDEVNQDSDWPNSIPEDWIFFAGPTQTPGKRVRITGMEPAGPFRFKLSARDEVAEYYALAGGGTATDVPSGERLVARAFNLGIIDVDAGGRKLVWQLENAHGAEVVISVNNGPATQVPVQGYLSVVGDELLLPDYAPGTHLAIQVLPIAAGTPVAVEGDSLSITV